MQKGQITAPKYKELQEAGMKSATRYVFPYLSEKLKEAIEMDLFDLKDMCNNNVQEWFESLVNDSGDNYEDQKAKYDKLKGQKGKSKEEP